MLLMVGVVAKYMIMIKIPVTPIKCCVSAIEDN